ncbi:hypothetical protein ACB092_12G077100 [Castanea dentata]
MDNRGDFIQRLGLKISINILNLLDDPSDLVRACAVSRSWSRFEEEVLLELILVHWLALIGIIDHKFRLCKQLCLKLFPELSSVTHVIEVENLIEPVKFSAGGSPEWERLKRDNRVYAFFAQGLTPLIKKDCIIEPISASSTDNYPDERIQNTLEPEDRIGYRASYWSSKGESDPNVPEILTYKLVAQLCVVTEIQVQPFQAYFQHGFPIYSSKAVRFRLGYSRHPLELDDDTREGMLIHYQWSDDDFIWTYTSPEFPVAQENELQKFKLPEAVLCIGGILQVELMGRVQKQEMDGLYYICVSHVQSSTQLPEGEADTPSRLRTFTTRLLQLLGNGPVGNNELDQEPPVL